MQTAWPLILRIGNLFGTSDIDLGILFLQAAWLLNHRHSLGRPFLNIRLNSFKSAFFLRLLPFLSLWLFLLLLHNLVERHSLLDLRDLAREGFSLAFGAGSLAVR